MITARDLLAAHPFMEGFSADQLTALSAWAHRSQFHAGARIFSEGGRADKFWLIRDGHVSLDAQVPGRGQVVIETLGPGTVLGWSWLFAPYRWHFGATAVEPTLTVELDAVGIRRLSESDPVLGYDLSRRFMKVVIDRLQATRVRLLDLYTVP